jgi:hypothetical protein
MRARFWALDFGVGEMKTAISSQEIIQNTQMTTQNVGIETLYNFVYATCK